MPQYGLVASAHPHGQSAQRLGPAAGRLGDAGEDLEQRALAGAVAADDADDLAALDLEGDVAQGPDGVLAVGRLGGGKVGTWEGWQAETLEGGCEGVAQGVVALLRAADAVELAQVFDADGDVTHGLFLEGTQINTDGHR